MKIKLILAASRTDPLRKNDPFMPLSLPILAAAAPGHDYTLVDLLWEDDVRFGDPVDLVGISFRSTAENRAYEIADEFRRRGVKVVLGGPQASSIPYRAITHADAVAVGEAEGLWAVIVEDARQARLNGFYVCSPKPFDGAGHSVYQQYDYPDFASHLVPRRDLYRRRYTFDTVYAVRGCHVNCDFCSVTNLFGAQYRTRPIEHVVAEIDKFRNYYYLLDDTVFGRPSTYRYYQTLYQAVAGLRRRRYWTGQANLDAAGDEQGRQVIQAAARAGLLYASVGMESVDPRSLEESGAIRKMGASSPESVIRAMKDHIRFIQDQGILVSGWFVIGYEHDSIETYDRTLDFCNETNVVPAIFFVKALPGTRLYERLREQGRLDDSRLINVRHPSMSDEDVLRALSRSMRRGYRFSAVMKRAARIFPHFKGDRIHKLIFSIVTQYKLRGGLDVSHDEFHAEAGGS